MKSVTFLTALASLSLSACGQRGPVADNVNQSGNVVAAVNAANAKAAAVKPADLPPTEGPSANMRTAGETGGIPGALRGRWGLSPEDCTTTRGDAKGLLEITADQLRFYESRATPSAKVQTSADSLSGNFAFTGEGQSWTRYETLQLQKDKLIRTERDPMESFIYVRCR